MRYLPCLYDFLCQNESDLWLKRFPCRTIFYGMAGDTPKICPICSLSLAMVLRLNYHFMLMELYQ